MLDTHVWLKVLLRCLTSEAIFRSDVYKKVWSPSLCFGFDPSNTWITFLIRRSFCSGNSINVFETCASAVLLNFCFHHRPGSQISVSFVLLRQMWWVSVVVLTCLGAKTQDGHFEHVTVWSFCMAFWKFDETFCKIISGLVSSYCVSLAEAMSFALQI